MINQVGSGGGVNPLSLSRAERAEKVDQALDNLKVRVSQLSPEQLATNRQYGLKMVDDIAAARFAQAPQGVPQVDFQNLAARLT